MNTDPQNWFLNDAEIVAARGGHSRELSTFTSENLVQPLIDGEEMFSALVADIKATTQGDFIHLSAWKLDADLNINPRSTDQPLDTVLNLWSAATQRGVNCRMLLWRNQLVNFRSMWKLLEKGIDAILDARFPILGSHHQKFGVLSVNGEAIAYCGGIDLGTDRWDTRQHVNDLHRSRESYAAWHDVHSRIRGAAVLDLELNFRDRWNDSEWPSIIPIPTPDLWIPHPIAPPEKITQQMPQIASSPGSHHVQVLRTFACKDNNYPTFAPRGETTCLHGYLKAISLATEYIYIEDQYMVSLEIANAIAAVLPRINKVVLVVPKLADTPPISAFNYHQAVFIETLKKIDASKVHVYNLVQPSTGELIYVHSKLMIVDDIYAVIGSQNINVRSMTYDTEIAVAVVDEMLTLDGVCQFAKDFRLSLWGEHLDLDTLSSLLQNPIEAMKEWERQADLASVRVRHHVTPDPKEEWGLIWNNVHDPDGRCD